MSINRPLLVWGGKIMNITQKGNKITITHELKKSETYKISKGNKSSTFIVFKKPQLVKGYSNSTSDGKAILMIDYDNVDKSVVLEDYKLIQDIYSLPPAYLFQTKDNNYHVVCLKKFFPYQLLGILELTRCDINYKTMPLRNPYRNYVLRLSDKRGSKPPKFIEMIGDVICLDYEISTAHLKLVEKYPKVPKIEFTNQDNKLDIQIQTYET